MKLSACFLFSYAAAQVGMCGKYGCVVNMDTTGCSGTCNQDGHCSGSGITCSERLAGNDKNNLWKYRTQAKRAGSSKNIDHCIIGAIISRETRAGAALQTWNGQYGWGDCYGGQCYGWGLMQVDRRYHNVQGAWDSQQHMEQATGILIDTINCVGRNHSRLVSRSEDQGRCLRLQRRPRQRPDLRRHGYRNHRK